MIPGKYDLTIYRGDSYHYRFLLWEDDANTLPTDLTGAIARAEMRTSVNGPVFGEMDLVVTLPNTIDGVLSAAMTAAIAYKHGVWDLQITRAETVRTVLAGKVKLIADVTLEP